MDVHDHKKRRIPRACDACRHKKIRCNSAEQPDNICTHCRKVGLDCLHTNPIKKRGPLTLERRGHKQLESVAGVDSQLSDSLDSSFVGHARSGSSTPVLPSVPSLGVIPPVTSGDEPNAEEGIHDGLFPAVSNASPSVSNRMADLPFDPRLDSAQFLGNSSGMMLVQSALDLKDQNVATKSGSIMWLSANRRPEFWRTCPWERQTMISESAHWHFVFPEYSLMGTLIALYFKHINTSVPILHRPTFETNVGEGLHLRDRYFGAVVLLVCALGSRYTNDPRTLPEGYPNRHAAGYMWFEQVPWLRKSLLESPCLYEVQLYALASFYLLSTSSPQAAWTTCGVALRFCQALGVHRKNSRRKAADGQHWKRVFWSLIIADRIYSSFMGRSCCIQSEDIDIDLPAECDDEYWDTGDPSTSFKQPPGKPSQMAYMTCLAQLSEILAFALRNLYSTKKYLTLVGHTGPDWERQMVSDLDSALNKWLDSVPDFLRWDPNREDPQFFEQSCSLYCIFYHTQIQIHRQFISKKSPLMFTSLAICTNAARSCSRLFSLMIRRGAIVSIPQHMILAFTAGVVLLMNIWGGKKTGLVNDPVHEMSDVQACLDFLKIMESGWLTAGRFWDMLNALMQMCNIVASPSPQMARKRTQDGEVRPAIPDGLRIPSVFTQTMSSPPRPQPQTSTFSGISATPSPDVNNCFSSLSLGSDTRALTGIFNNSALNADGSSSTATATPPNTGQNPMNFAFQDFIFSDADSGQLRNMLSGAQPAASDPSSMDYISSSSSFESAVESDQLCQQWSNMWTSAPFDLSAEALANLFGQVPLQPDQ